MEITVSLGMDKIVIRTKSHRGRRSKIWWSDVYSTVGQVRQKTDSIHETRNYMMCLMLLDSLK